MGLAADPNPHRERRKLAFVVPDKRAQANAIRNPQPQAFVVAQVVYQTSLTIHSAAWVLAFARTTAFE
jgi:hypothetical protein